MNGNELFGNELPGNKLPGNESSGNELSGDELLRLEIKKTYPEFQMEVALKVNRGEIFSLVGPSGCGKTTLLRLIAGLEEPDHGTIILDGREITSLPPAQRRVGLVFQDYALFPHLTVAGNSLALRSAARPRPPATPYRAIGPFRPGGAGPPADPAPFRRGEATGRPGPGAGPRTPLAPFG